MTKEEAHFKEVGTFDKICGDCEHCNLSLSGNFKIGRKEISDHYCDKLGRGAYLISTISLCDLWEKRKGIQTPFFANTNAEFFNHRII